MGGLTKLLRVKGLSFVLAFGDKKNRRSKKQGDSCLRRNDGVPP
jgi:hypothetical protein